MFAVMQGGYDHERNEEEKLQKNKSKKSKTLYLPFHSLICPLPASGITYSKLTVEATQKKAQEPHKYYTEIRVQRGDTLWDIANKYMDSSVYRSL
ncbi:MAG: LysM peptidoglycan-binding domain-containing protein [Lachnospiraceae bacterium]